METRLNRLVRWAFLCGLWVCVSASVGCDLHETPADDVPPAEIAEPDVQVVPDTTPPDSDTVDVVIPPETVPEDPEVTPPAPTGDGMFGAEPFTRAIATPNGRYVLVQAAAEAGNCLHVVDLETRKSHVMDGLCDLAWMVAAPDSNAAHLLAADRVLTLRLADRQVTRELSLGAGYSVLDVAPTGAALVASNRPTTDFELSQFPWFTDNADLRRLAVVDLTADSVHETSLQFGVRSLALLPEEATVLAITGTWGSDGLPVSHAVWLSTTTGQELAQTQFANCAAQVSLSPTSGLAAVAPTECFQHPVTLTPPPPPEEPEDWEEPPLDEDDWFESDPVSVLDLAGREFVGNLPGFGPAAISPDGATAVGFSRRETMMKQWNMFQTTDFGLIVIRLDDLYWQMVDYGDAQPDFFFAPDGTLWLHDREGGTDHVRRFDLESQTLTTLSGPASHLDERAPAPDGTVHLVVAGKLRRLTPDAQTIQSIALDSDIRQLFQRPDGTLSLVTPDAVAVFDPATDTPMFEVLF